MKNSDLQSYKEELVGFSGEKVSLDGFITLHVTLGSRPKTRTIKVDFFIIDCLSAYNVILGRPTLNKIGAIIFTACLTIKFFTDDGEIATMRANQVTARRCYNTSLEIAKKKESKAEGIRATGLSNVMLIDLDVRG